MRRFALLPLAAALALPALALPSAALARDHGTAKAAAEMNEIAATLQDPAVQDDMAATVTGFVDALMAMKVGPLARLAGRFDPKSDLADADPDATVADLMKRRDRKSLARLDGDVRAGTGAMGDMTAMMAAMLPALDTMTRDMEARWKERKQRD
ncbi:MAG: hypothetical protein RLZZ58_2018 [Pseudomonadota bacterium]|jgi:hypothetical protein